MQDSPDFEIDHRIAAMSVHVDDIADIDVRLVNDSRYHWLLLVPALPDIVEVDDLPPSTASALFKLAGDLGAWLKSYAKADKINIAMIGNVVPQIHVHVVARHIDDEHWPDPIWGRGAPVPLPDDILATRKAALNAAAAKLAQTR